MTEAKPAGGCVAVIPARGGSKGIPGKNLRRVGGIPLVGRAVAAARSCRSVDEVYVSTDDAQIAAVAREFGAGVIDRPAEISGDTASSEAALLHALEVLAGRGRRPALLAFLQCTSPFTTPESVERVVAALNDSTFAMAFSAKAEHYFLWRPGADGSGMGVNHDHTRPRRRRQDLPPEWRETGAIYVMRVPEFLRSGNRFCGPACPVPLDLPTMEIDEPEDLLVIEALFAARGAGAGAGKRPPEGLAALITDFDGVHTDDCVCVDQNGVESVRCCRADGMGVEMLRQAGIEVLILSREENPAVAMRAKKLEVEVIHGCRDKRHALERWATKRRYGMEKIAYMGNDHNDLECISIAGWSACPSDAHPLVRMAANYVTTRAGGHGAIREVAEAILGL